MDTQRLLKKRDKKERQKAAREVAAAAELAAQQKAKIVEADSDSEDSNQSGSGSDDEEGEEEMSEDSKSEKESVNIEEETKAVEQTGVPTVTNDEGKHCFLVNPYFVLGYFSSIKLSEMPLAEQTLKAIKELGFEKATEI